MTQEKCGDCGKPLLRLPSTGECWHCKRRGRERAAAVRRRENPRVLYGVDVDAAVADLITIPVYRELLGRKPIAVDVGHCAQGGCGGRAWTHRRKIRIYSGPDSPGGAARVLEVVLHELCHLAVAKHGHDERFRRVFARAVREAWGIEVPIDVERGAHGNRSYAMGERVTEALAAKLAAGEVEAYPPAAPEPKPGKAERTAGLVARREAHAVRMLARAERRLKIAKTVQRRWAQKVRYYERVAAKKKGGPG